MSKTVPRVLRVRIQLPLVVLAIVLIGGGGTAMALRAASSESNPTVDDHAAILASMAAARDAALQKIQADPGPALLSKSGPVPPAATPEPWPQGLLSYAVAPVSPADYVFNNQWQWDINGHHVQVYAGAVGHDSPEAGRGLLWVRETAFDLAVLPAGGFFLAPSGTGTLSIESYDGMELTVTSQNGQTFLFDAKSLTFTGADGYPIASDTPAPAGAGLSKPTYPAAAPLPEGATPTPVLDTPLPQAVSTAPALPPGPAR